MSRTHFARYMVDRGVCHDVPEVFRNYLIEGKPGYVPHRWATLAQAVGWITGAGGVAIIAHPGRYKFDAMAYDALFDEFRQPGRRRDRSRDRQPYARPVRRIRRRSRSATASSPRAAPDFHAPGESRVDFGELPPLPASVTPVWHDWAI